MAADRAGSLDHQEAVPGDLAATPTWQRLEAQIRWYDSKSVSAQRWYRILKTLALALAASIPFLAGLQSTPWITGLAGVLVVVLEGLQSLGQYQHNWIVYRSTCEDLRHEKYLFLADAGVYPGAADARRLLAERVESLVSQEHAKWIATRKEGSAKLESAKK